MIRYFFLLSLIFLLFSSCAEQRPLTGGPKDTQPPRLDSSRYSTPNLQTNFKEKEIILTFNEWVVLNDPANQMLISPPLQNKPEVKIKNKSVVLKFKEELQPNTTYSVQFGEAVKDYTENNPAQNLRFVFSTGPILDSLNLFGQVTDAIAGTPVDKVWVMIYAGTDDSLPYKERPLYISKTDAQGGFRFENIREGNFKIFALIDNNNNYKYDQAAEQIAFLPEPLFLSDSTQGILKLRLFKEEEPVKILSAKVVDRNRLKLQFNQSIYDKIILQPLLPGNLLTVTESGRDSLLYWFNGAPADNWKLRLEIPALAFVDTIDVKGGEEGKLPEKALVVSVQEAGSGAAKTKAKPDENFYLHPKKGGEMDYSRPIKSVDFDKIQVLDSTTVVKSATKIDSTHPRRLIFQPATALNSSVSEIRILPGAITDIWGETNTDTLKRTYKVLKDKDLGNLKVKITNADSSMNYIVRLLDEKDLPIIEFYFTNSTIWEKAFPFLEPKRYTIEVVHDNDANKRYTAGNYLQKRQPETQTRSKPISLRADWDNEMEIDLNSLSKKKIK